MLLPRVTQVGPPHPWHHWASPVLFLTNRVLQTQLEAIPEERLQKGLPSFLLLNSLIAKISVSTFYAEGDLWENQAGSLTLNTFLP